ncbi:17285_t:CDS:1 [Funneliformis geosporum]|uniref:17285_t:CDS:1 n=1 Tax=Funneliformis geosporum TaxID=1117311 RepID=A0A9W4T687_9GLOM|nr:17285_t:CDS:1 [Funneliformis geosporum]
MVNEIGINSLETTKSLLGIAGVAGEDKETIKPYATLIAAATSIINETIQIYENAEYNKKICNALMDRVQIANGVIKTLNRRKQENEKNFRNELYYKNFVRFVDILGRIKDFIKDVSQLQGYKKYLLANSIKDKFNNLTNDFESVMKDLNFTMSEEQKAIDREALEEGIQELKKQMEEKEKQGEERRIISSLIPTERLFIIRSNIKQFLKK